MAGSLDTSLCFIDEFNTVEEALKNGLGISKSQIKKQKLGKDFLNSKLDRGRIINLSYNLINQGIVNPKYEGPEIEIIFEDERLLALNKPHKIHCHPHTYLEKNNCLSFLRENLYFPRSEFCHGKGPDLGLLYRLDLETSGVLILAKKKDDYEKIRADFLSFSKEKIYVAIVHGKLDMEGIQESFFKATSEKGKKIQVSNVDFHGPRNLGKGVLEIKPIAYDDKLDLTFIKVKLETGLRHQIRAQLSFLGYPILGDTLYDGKLADRMYLHAHKYQINFPEKNYEIVAEKAPLFDSFFNLNSIL